MSPLQFITIYFCITVCYTLWLCRTGSFLHKIRKDHERRREEYGYHRRDKCIISDSHGASIGFINRKQDILFVSILCGIIWPIRLIYFCIVYLFAKIIAKIWNATANILIGD